MLTQYSEFDELSNGHEFLYQGQKYRKIDSNSRCGIGIEGEDFGDIIFFSGNIKVKIEEIKYLKEKSP